MEIQKYITKYHYILCYCWYNLSESSNIKHKHTNLWRHEHGQTRYYTLHKKHNYSLICVINMYDLMLMFTWKGISLCLCFLSLYSLNRNYIAAQQSLTWPHMRHKTQSQHLVMPLNLNANRIAPRMMYHSSNILQRSKVSCIYWTEFHNQVIYTQALQQITAVHSGMQSALKVKVHKTFFRSGKPASYQRTFNTFTAIVDHSCFNSSCLKSPASTLVDLTFQSRALRSFSLNHLRNLSL